MGNAVSIDMDALASDPWAWAWPLVAVVATVAAVKIGNRIVFTRRVRQRIADRTEVRLANLNTIREQLDSNKKEEEWTKVLALDFKSLLRKLRSGELSSVVALQAFQNKAIEVNDKTNSVVHFVEDAIEWARDRDAVPVEARGPLHGLPISVKECYFIKGCDSTAGLSEFTLSPCSSDSPVVSQLKALGAVPFCQTNVPQTMFSLQCSNPAYGATSNPHDLAREPGGSSGGEGALLAGGGSVLGIGSDLGGSLRNPAAMCGIYSLRPTFGRHLSQMGVRGPVQYDPVGLSVVGGFMSREVCALAAAWKSVWTDRSVDPRVAPVPWNEERFSAKRKLRLGYFVQDGYFELHPGCARAVERAVGILKAQGHEVVPFPAPDMSEVFRVYLGLIFADESAQVGASLARDLKDSAAQAVRVSVFMNKLPSCLQAVIFAAVRLFTKFPSYAPFRTALELQAGVSDRDRMTLDYLDSMREAGIDAVLTPAAWFPATKLGTTGQLGVGVEPYIMANLFDLPAGIATITSVNEDDESKLESIKTSDLAFRMMRSAARNGVGLPLAVQVVAQRYDEEVVLRVMAELEANKE